MLTSDKHNVTSEQCTIAKARESVCYKRNLIQQISIDNETELCQQEHTGHTTGFYARQHICYSVYMPHQFHPPVTRVYCIKTAERIIEILSPSDRPIILVFRHQGSLHKSGGFTPNRGIKYKGG